MGNTVIGAQKVQVLQINGKILEFDQPMVVAELMRRHRHHFVVRFRAMTRQSVKKRSRAALLLPHSVLVPGEAYLLVPVPPHQQYALVDRWRMVRAFTPSLDIGNHQVGSRARDVQQIVMERQWGIVRAAVLLLLQQSISDLLQSSLRAMGRPTTTNSRLLEYQKIVARRQRKKYRPMWKPTLESIPELEKITIKTNKKFSPRRDRY